MEKTKIEYCDSSWNPVSGCYGQCSYCYACRTAERLKGCDVSPDGQADQEIIILKEHQHYTAKDGRKLKASYPYGFIPTLHEYRLNVPQTKNLGETVSVCSMGDLFGPWVPDEWILKVFDACKAAPGHRWLFLTKYPERYIALSEKGLLPEGDDFWYGSTVTDPHVMTAFCEDGKYRVYACVEPILETFEDADAVPFLAATLDWIILGAETGGRKEKVVPERKWIEGLVKAFQKAGKPVFMKDSMKPIWRDDILTELPWKPR